MIKMPDPPTAAEIDGFPRENRASDGFPGLRQRCEVLGLEVQGSPAQLKAGLKVYFGHQQPAPRASIPNSNIYNYICITLLGGGTDLSRMKAEGHRQLLNINVGLNESNCNG